jgi:acyl-CoA oxidase
MLDAVDRIKRGDFTTLPEIHATSAGLKAFCTTLVSEGIEDCRKCCGGHGYSKASGFSNLYTDFTPSQTYEGDNTVLYLQTARFLAKCCIEAQMGNEIPDTVAYLNDNSPLTRDDWCMTDVQLRVYGERAKYIITQATSKLQSLIDKGWQRHEAWNACSIQLAASAHAHCYYILVKNFIDGVNQLLHDRSLGERRVLKMMSDLFALHGIIESPGSFLECGILTSDHLVAIRFRVAKLLEALRLGDTLFKIFSIYYYIHFLMQTRSSCIGRCF